MQHSKTMYYSTTQNTARHRHNTTIQLYTVAMLIQNPGEKEKKEKVIVPWKSTLSEGINASVDPSFCIEGMVNSVSKTSLQMSSRAMQPFERKEMKKKKKKKKKIPMFSIIVIV